MAGDWIKMRTNLWNDPRVSRLVDLTETTEATVIGGLYWLWATADEHSMDGAMPGLTLRAVDRKTGVAGLAEALVTVGWLAEDPDGVRLVRFDEHNGASAKTRAQTAKRVANHRSNSDVTQGPLHEQHDSVTDALAREREEKEKRREEGKGKADRASRLPADWMPDAECIEFCRAERPDLDLDSVASQFRDYWIAQPGTKGRKTDWMATWRNWVRNQRGAPKGAAPRQQRNDRAAAAAGIFGLPVNQEVIDV
jgi:hypothetical protein